MMRGSVLVALIIVSTATDALAARRGLVVGNGLYIQVNPLGTPASDARAIAASLDKLGFATGGARVDLDKLNFEKALTTFVGTLKEHDTVFIYYAGHAVQLNGVNYLLPVDIAPTSAGELASRAVSLDSIFSALRSAKTGPNIVVVDACRNNPWADEPVNGLPPTKWLPGLAAPTNAPPNTLIGYATDPGGITGSGTVEHSLYTAALLRQLKIPAAPVEEIFKRVAQVIVEATNGGQSPWINSSLTQPVSLSDPIEIIGVIAGADDEVLLLVNGDEVASWNADGPKPVRIALQPGANEVVVKVYNQRTFTGYPEHLPEGWRYDVRLRRVDGSEMVKLESDEDVPEKDGPRHGRLFTAGRAVVHVDIETGAVTVAEADRLLWRHSGRPAAAQPGPVDTPTPAPGELTAEARQNIDWSRGNTGAVDCDLQYGDFPVCIFLGGRSCVMQRAVAAAKVGNCHDAFRWTLTTQCHNAHAQETIRSSGEAAVCAYLAREERGHRHRRPLSGDRDRRSILNNPRRLHFESAHERASPHPTISPACNRRRNVSSGSTRVPSICSSRSPR